MSRNKKEYILVKALGQGNKAHKLFIWGCKDLSKVPINTAYFASEIDKSEDFGFSANVWKMRKIE